MKAVVMAGGEGSRLRPLTSQRPKPLAPVADKPVMEHIIALLRRLASDWTVRAPTGVVVAAGAPEAVEKARPLLEAVGQRVFAMSETAEVANLIKLSGNFLIASVIESLGEAMALVGKVGVDPHAYVDMLTATLFNAPVYKTYGGLIADRKFTPAGFAAPLGLKDIRLALAAGDALRVPMPVASLLRDRFLTLLARGGDGLDWSAVGGMAARDAGEK